MIGFGHLMRCRQLARALKTAGLEPAMFGPSATYRSEQDAALFTVWREAPAWRSGAADSAALLAYGDQLGVSGYVLDDSRVDEAYQRELRRAGAKWLQFAPNAETPIFADIVFCAHPAARHEAFERVCRKDALLLIGPRFALLREGFRDLPRRGAASALRQLLLTFGGGCDRGAAQLAIEALVGSPSRDIRLVLATGRGNPNNDALLTLSNTMAGRLEVLIETDRMPELMAASDLAVMAAGTSSLEAAAAGLPMVLCAIADNQIAPATAWSHRGGAIFLGALGEFEAADIADAVARFSEPATRERATQALYAAGVDGRGAERVAHAVAQRLR